MDNKSDKLIVHWWKDGNVNDVISTIGYLVNLNAKEIQLAINKGIEEDTIHIPMDWVCQYGKLTSNQVSSIIWLEGASLTPIGFTTLSLEMPVSASYI